MRFPDYRTPDSEETGGVFANQLRGRLSLGENPSRATVQDQRYMDITGDITNARDKRWKKTYSIATAGVRWSR